MDAQRDFTPEEKESLQTANDLRKGQNAVTESGFTARGGDHLPILTLDYATLIQKFPNIGVLLSNNPNDLKSMAHQQCESRRSNHNDTGEHLPDLPYDYDDPTNTNGYYEYHVDHSGVKNPKNLRILYDSGRGRLYVSPSHYNSWKDNDGKSMNPFFLVANSPPLVCGGRVDFS